MKGLIRKMRRYLLAWLHRSRADKVLFVKQMSYKDIKNATDGFQRVIYINSDGAAYKARFDDGGGVSLVKEVKGFHQGEEDLFYLQVQLLGRLHHRHILALKGFSTGRKRLLVFDNIENGSLEDYLRDPLRTPLNWKTRLQIAIGVSAALEYLLLYSNPPVYHVSISSSNIMLDENFIPKITDVDLVSYNGDYVALPNCSRSRDCTHRKCGNLIFQLGVVILELVTGQLSDKGSTDIIQWIQESHFGNSIPNMIDPDLGNNYNSTELKSILAVARLCIKSKDNPIFCIPQIVRYLQKKVDIQI